MSCKHCKHSHTVRWEAENMVTGELEDKSNLVCRRYPPQLVTYGNMESIDYITEFPSVSDDDDCGEYGDNY